MGKEMDLRTASESSYPYTCMSCPYDALSNTNMTLPTSIDNCCRHVDPLSPYCIQPICNGSDLTYQEPLAIALAIITHHWITHSNKHKDIILRVLYKLNLVFLEARIFEYLNPANVHEQNIASCNNLCLKDTHGKRKKFWFPVNVSTKIANSH